MLHCIALCCAVLYCIVLDCTDLYCIVLYYTAQHYIVLYCAALGRIVSCFSVSYHPQDCKNYEVKCGLFSEKKCVLWDHMLTKDYVYQAYPSLKPLASWTLDLIQRMAFIQDWIDNGIPSVSIISVSFEQFC